MSRKDDDSMAWACANDISWSEMRQPGRHRGGNMFGTPKTEPTGKHAKTVKPKKVKSPEAAKVKAGKAKTKGKWW